eukprot:CAMPEP_0202887380 /NCGR_PEP_ID=MMETSP1391-20130828/42652_1 /ASSEMBLY_ACC=CAM_ASM_000867 /TAXON_ID=1034604 /ORGANISM="Chlamydomonas leiostraca, Strain SAG 11-49" /LENGTH=81 /DNA_ID=CAMNT_0049570667 /DNA_START=659 /DNA_END=904 /DNA_ORIENTATION=+
MSRAGSDESHRTRKLGRGMPAAHTAALQHLANNKTIVCVDGTSATHRHLPFTKYVCGTSTASHSNHSSHTGMCARTLLALG